MNNNAKKPLRQIGVIANPEKPRAREALGRLAKCAANLGIEVLPDAAAAGLMGRGQGVEPEDMFRRMDALIVLGGDGTLLRAARALDGLDKPVLGVNLGGLGFLTSVAEPDLERAVECLVKGTFLESVRAVAECCVRRRGLETARHRALNDVVLASATMRVVTLILDVGGERVSDFICDGLIVSTPTGSTGHSLSGGGPVIVPEARVFVVTPICAHTLSTRPLVVPDDATIRMEVGEGSGRASLSVDGQVGEMLEEGEAVEVRRSTSGIRFLHLPGHSHFAVLRQKLHWRGSSV